MERKFRRHRRNQARAFQITLCLVGGAVVLLTACRLGPKGAPGPLVGSAWQYDVSYSGGAGRFGGGPADSNSLHPEGTLAISVTFVPMDRWFEGALEPVTLRTQMITLFPASPAVVPVAGLLRSARVGTVRSETPFQEQIGADGADVAVEKLHGVLPYDVDASFRILGRPVLDSGAIRRLEIRVHRRRPREPDGGIQTATATLLEISLVATGTLQDAALSDGAGVVRFDNESGASVPSVPGMLVTETIVLTPQVLQTQDRLAVVLPSPLDVEGIAAFGALIEVKPFPPEGTDDAAVYAASLKQCRDDLLAAAGADGTNDGQQPGTGRRGIEDAIRLLQSPTHKQRALLHLAQKTGALLIEDMALSASDLVLDYLAHAITNEHLSGPPVEADVLGWRLEKAAYQFLTRAVSSDPASPDFEAILIRHAGEVGRHPAVLGELVSDAKSIDDLRQRLLLENFIYLEDISPAARARAFDWLAVQGQAPEGYDPLASLTERRRVLNRILQEQP